MGSYCPNEQEIIDLRDQRGGTYRPGGPVAAAAAAGGRAPGRLVSHNGNGHDTPTRGKSRGRDVIIDTLRDAGGEIHRGELRKALQSSGHAPASVRVRSAQRCNRRARSPAPDGDPGACPVPSGAALSVSTDCILRASARLPDQRVQVVPGLLETADLARPVVGHDPDPAGLLHDALTRQLCLLACALRFASLTSVLAGIPCSSMMNEPFISPTRPSVICEKSRRHMCNPYRTPRRGWCSRAHR